MVVVTPLFGVLVALAACTVAGFVHAHAQQRRRDDLQRSNARVLREFKRIAAMRPHFIVDNQPRRKP